MKISKKVSPLGTLPAINKKGALLKDTFPVPSSSKKTTLTPLPISPKSPQQHGQPSPPSLSPISPFTLSFGAFELAIAQQETFEEDSMNSSHFVKTHKHRLCLQMLTSGHVESFVDFFYLTHKKSKRKSAAEGQSSSDDKKLLEQQDLSPEVLNYLTECLTVAENAFRTGNAPDVSNAYRKLATHFEEGKEYLTAIHFHQKGLELSLELGDASPEGSTYRHIGVNYEMLGDIAKAIQYYDKFSELAQKDLGSKEVEISYQHLVTAYRTFAEQLERKAATSPAGVAEELLQQAIEFYRKCLNIAHKCGDLQAVGTANYKLGLVYKQMQQSELSIQHLKNYLAICKNTQDEAGESIACSALADVFNATNDTEESVRYLEENISLANRTNQPLNHAQACRDLGVIYNRRGDYEKAVEYFEKCYDISVSAQDRPGTDTAKVYLGVARGNLKMKQIFMDQQQPQNR